MRFRRSTEDVEYLDFGPVHVPAVDGYMVFSMECRVEDNYQQFRGG